MAGLSFLATDLGIIARIESRAESGVTCRYRIGDVSVRAGEPTSGTISVQRPMRIDDRLAIEGALRGLPTRQRWAVVLCDVAGLTSGEAARALHSTASTVRVHLARGRAALRTILSEPASGSSGPRDPSTRGPVE